jgi:hypothetical protein
MLIEAIHPPQILDQVNPEFMSEIQRVCPEQSTGTEWHRDPLAQNDKPELLEALLPLNRILLDKLCKHEPWAVYYQVDTRSTLPAESQRHIGWHVDGDGGGMSVLVASALPTEFLVATNSPFSPVKNYKLVKESGGRGASLDSAKCEEFIENGTSAIYTPRPYELAILRGHIHRSPINDSEQTIARCWIRAAIHQERPVVSAGS